MGVIVGSGTTVGGVFSNGISANWGASPNTQRLYVLGSTTAFMTIKKPTATLSITVYSKGPGVGVAASNGCIAASVVSASVTGGACGSCGGGGGVSGSWYLTSYSFSKEVSMPGQESFSMMQYITAPEAVMPSLVLRGIAEGSWTDNSGVTGEDEGQASSGSVSAGGMGRTDSMTVGTVSSVGGASAALKDTGQASVSVPYTPIYC